MRRTADGMRRAVQAIYKLEQKILVAQSGVTTLRDLLQEKGQIAREEWAEVWEARMESQLRALEKRERFSGAKDRISTLYSGGSSARFRVLLDEAENALLELDVDRAHALLEAALELDPGNHELAFFLGESCFNDGRGAPASVFFETVLEAKPDHLQSLVYAGVLQHEAGHSERAETLLKRAVAAHPDELLPAFALGAVLAGRERLAQAVVWLERAIDIEPFPQAHYLLGSCAWRMGRSTLAIRHLREAVRLDPGMVEGHELLALACLDRSWTRQAASALERAQSLDPRTLGYGELVRLLQQVDEPLPEIRGEARDSLRRGEELLEKGQPREALSAYREARLRDDRNPTLLVAYAIACLELDRLEEVEPALDQVLAMPESAERLKATACLTWMEALRSQGRFREGNRIGRGLLEDSRSAFARSVALRELAVNLAEMGEDLDEALDLARQAVDDAPDDALPLSWSALGWVHYRRREFEEAARFLESATGRLPSSRNLHQYGMALLALGRRKEARQALVEARDMQEHRGRLDAHVLECLKDGARRLGELG